MSIFQDQANFMARGNQKVDGNAADQRAMYADLITEEATEFKETGDPYYQGRPSDDVRKLSMCLLSLRAT